MKDAETTDTASIPSLVIRSAFGGVLMGLANLVPGISGGTMLLAAGIYPRFIDAISDVTRLRFRFRSLLVLASVVAAAGLAIVLLAGTVKDLVLDHRWVMYSLFIGLTLGGVPVVWRLARPVSRGVWIGAVVGFVAMAALAVVQMTGAGAGGMSSDRNYALLFLAGVAGASAMILPGVSGGYLLLVLGQYVPILASIDRTKDAFRAGDVSALLAEGHVVVPVGIGVVLGVVVVSNLLRMALHRFQQPTLGVLLGLLIGAIVGLWPFQAGVAPAIGDVVKGQVVTEQTLAEIDEEDWPVATFQPTPTQLGAALVLIGVGFGVTLGVSFLGRDKKDAA